MGSDPRIIYDNYLDRWFKSVFSADEYSTVRKVFEELGEVDDDVFADLIRVAESLQSEAFAVLDLVSKSKSEDARHQVLAMRSVFRPLRVRIAETMQQLYKLKAEFAESAAVA